MELKTGYEWCLKYNRTPINLSAWVGSKSFSIKDFYEEKIDHDSFHKKIVICDYELGLIPKKPETFLQYRMYGLVPYNLSPIQQGIQFAHAVVEYQQMSRSLPHVETIYNKWAKNDKTFIILNGGTTCENIDRLGTLQSHVKTLEDNSVLTAKFYEPDLNDTLTAVVFLVDERVYNRELYPDFDYNNGYDEWLEMIGGKRNEFLRNFLETFKLA